MKSSTADRIAKFLMARSVFTLFWNLSVLIFRSIASLRPPGIAKNLTPHQLAQRSRDGLSFYVCQRKLPKYAPARERKRT
jgi:hypothetical protein